MQIARLTQVNQVKLETGESSYRNSLIMKKPSSRTDWDKKENISGCPILIHLYFGFSSSHKRKSKLQ